MRAAILVFLGGGFGSVFRFFIGKYLNLDEAMPYGTFLVNILGSLFIGIVLGFAAKETTISQQHTLLLASGFCGGFTTFSAFAYENYNFLKQGDLLSFALYTIASLSLGILAVFLGMYLVSLTTTD